MYLNSMQRPVFSNRVVPIKWPDKSLEKNNTISAERVVGSALE